MKTKVAIIYHYFAHYRLPIFKELIKEEDIDFTFYGDNNTSKGIRLIEFEKEEALDFVRCNNVWVFKLVLIQLLPFWDILKNDQIIILGNPKILSSYFLALFARLLGKKVIIWSHFVYSREETFKNWVMVNYCRMGHALMSYNNFAANFLKEKLPEKIIRPIYNSLDFSKINLIYNKLDVKKEMGLKDEKLINIIFIGRLTKAKDLDLLLHACAILKNIRLTIIGGGEQEKGLKALAEKLGIEGNIHFVGPCYKEEVIGNFFKEMDICISPGPVGLTAVHAFHYGVPVITHNNDINQGPEWEIIEEGTTGAFFKEHDVNDLVQTIDNYYSYLLDNRSYVHERCRRQIVEFYNPNFQRRRISNVIHTLRDL